MPLPSDEKLVQLGKDLLEQFDTIFGLHPGYRPAHAKGTLLTGKFTPSPEARYLTRAPHVTRESTPITVRFSDSTGLPAIPDNDPNANPRGMAIRFHLADHVHTDIISHSADGFPVRTGQEFLDMLRAVAASTQSTSSPSPIERFLSTHPAALAYMQMPKPNPSSFAQEAFFGVTAFRFVNGTGVRCYGRYRILPEAGIAHLDDTAAKSKPSNYLFEEIHHRIASEPVRFKIQVQIAQAGDIVDDATIQWPAGREIEDFGVIDLTARASDDDQQQARTIFDPIPRIDGIDPSGDPLLELRAALYLLSGRRRRQASEPRTRVSGA
jgi:catalase